MDHGPQKRSDLEIARRFLHAMQRGLSGEDELVSLFADDGVYVESLTTGEPRAHHGRAAIRLALHEGLKWNPPDFTVTLDRLEVERGEVVANWTCRSSRLPGPMRGVDRYLVEEGVIKRLETRAG